MPVEKKRRRFRLLKGCGPHYEPNPDFDPKQPEDEENFRSREISPGQKFWSDRDLTNIFVNKFECLDAPGNRSGIQSAGGDTSDDPENDPDKDRPVRSAEDSLHRRANRFLEEDELEGKDELQELAKGKKVSASEDDGEEEPEEDQEVEEDSFDDEPEELPKKKKKKKK